MTINKVSLEQAFGFSPRLEGGGKSPLPVFRVDESKLSALMRHWESLDGAKLPCLSGINTSPAESSRALLNLFFDLGNGEPVVCMEAELAGDRAFPDFSRVWPYAAWWQEELRTFAGVRFAGISSGRRVQWQLP
jgi:Ni,Fe-hydrogenase III component G